MYGWKENFVLASTDSLSWYDAIQFDYYPSKAITKTFAEKLALVPSIKEVRFSVGDMRLDFIQTILEGNVYINHITFVTLSVPVTLEMMKCILAMGRVEHLTMKSENIRPLLMDDKFCDMLIEYGKLKSLDIWYWPWPVADGGELVVTLIRSTKLEKLDLPYISSMVFDAIKDSVYIRSVRSALLRDVDRLLSTIHGHVSLREIGFSDGVTSALRRRVDYELKLAGCTRTMCLVLFAYEVTRPSKKSTIPRGFRDLLRLFGTYLEVV